MLTPSLGAGAGERTQRVDRHVPRAANRFPAHAHWREAGLPQTFTIMDTRDQVSLIKRRSPQR